MAKDNLSGKTFGFMKVLYEDPNKNGTKSRNAYWFCECQGCKEHTIKSICGSDLKRGRVTNCGCQKTKRIIEYNHNRFNDLTDKTYGFLKVIEPIFEGENFTNLYKCQCICKKITTVYRNNLLSGGTTSCGCKNQSLGEINTEKALKELNINFLKQYSFEGLYGDSLQLRFDFAIKQDNKVIAVIECQGQQHFYPIDIFGGEERFKKQQEYDNKKKEYCKNNNILLIEIPYSDYSKIDTDYLQNKINFLQEKPQLNT